MPEGAGSYRTGDKCFVDETGMLHFCGRLDFQVKLHGYRIELGDIESNLCLLPEVRQTDAGREPRKPPANYNDIEFFRVESQKFKGEAFGARLSRRRRSRRGSVR